VPADGFRQLMYRGQRIHPGHQLDPARERPQPGRPVPVNPERIRNENLREAGVRERLGFAQGGDGNPGRPVPELAPGDLDGLVRLRVRPQRQAAARGAAGHRPQVLVQAGLVD